MKKIIAVVLAGVMCAFVANAAFAQTANAKKAPAKTAAKQQKPQKTQTATKTATQTKAVKPVAAKTQTQVAKPAAAKTQTQVAKPAAAKATPVAATNHSVSTNMGGAEPFAAFEAAFVANDSFADVSAAQQQATQDVVETEEVLSPSAPR